jgi:Ca2+-binding RTX toxin-like protein
LEIVLMWKREFRRAHTRRPNRRRPSRRFPLVELSGIELLDRRVLPAVTALFSAGTLRVTGDDQDNVITISRDEGGTILVNNGDVAIQGGTATVANMSHLHLVGAGGNDNISLNESNGALPGADFLGGAGDDVLIGGSGDDFFDGDAGNDTVFMGAGDDTFQWNPGDGSDTVDGQIGSDTMVFNGSDASENIVISANGDRVQFTRDVGNVTMDLDGVEEIDFNALGGADTITANNQRATDLDVVKLNLDGTAGGGDGQTDAVIINGTENDDFAQVATFDNGMSIVASVGSFPFVSITGAEVTNDQLTLNGLGGNDTVDASGLPANLIGMSINGGAGNDTIVGSQGDDLVNGGPGNDVAQMGGGRDTFVWNPGDGNDTVNGQGDADRLVINGSDASENFDVSANGNRVRLTRNVGNVTMDLNGIETMDVNALGGSDIITVNDTSATDLSSVNLNLDNSAGNGDGQADAVVINGTEGDDHIQILPFGSGTRVAVLGLFSRVNIVGADGTIDHLTVNALAGNDTVDASGLPDNLIGLTVNLGDGQGTTATTTTLRTSAATGVFGQTELLTATVNSLVGTPGGTVAFFDGNTVLAAVPINDAGQATLLVSLGVGNHALTAVFEGSAGFAASTSAVVAATVDQAATATALSLSANPAVAGQTIAFTATVTEVTPGAGAPTGTITFLDGGTVLGTAALGADRRATFVTAGFSAAGGHAITAIYSGDDNFAASSQAVAERVIATSALATTTTVLAASAKVVHTGQTVRFMAKVHATSGASKPTGAVSFLAGDVVVAQVRLNAAGRASFQHRFAAKGRFVIRAVYSGDSNFAGSEQSIIEQINGRRKPLVSVRHQLRKTERI